MSRKRFPPLRSFVIGSNPAIDRIMQQEGFLSANGLNDAEIVIFQGGEDVTPFFYGADKHPMTHNNQRRDEFELACYKATNGKFRIGICRGGQFLNVMNGGWMWQHVDGHGGQHFLRYVIKDNTKETIKYIQGVTSTHHQLMVPNKKTASVWGTASQTSYREGGTKDGKRIRMQMHGEHGTDTEIVYYNNTRSLCFQPHPEYNSHNTRELFFDCIERALAT